MSSELLRSEQSIGVRSMLARRNLLPRLPSGSVASVSLRENNVSMVICPRCKNQVDERAYAACPQCSTPLNAAAGVQPLSGQPNQPGGMPSAPGAQAPMPRAGVRVSLTGEAIGDNAGHNARTGPNYGNSPAGIPPLRPGGMPTGARPPASPYARRESAPDHSGRNALIINLSVALVLLLLCTGGGYWKWTHRTNPKAQVERLMHAVQWLDWGVYFDLHIPDHDKQTRRQFISMMDDKFDNNPLLKIAARHRWESVTFVVGEPVISGDHATVTVVKDAAALAAGDRIEFKLFDVGGVWMVDSSTRYKDNMPYHAYQDKETGNDRLGLPFGLGER